MKRLSDDPFDLRFGVICNLYYRNILGDDSVPKQIDLLDEFFPGLAIWEVNPDGALVFDSSHPLSDSNAYTESLPPESIDSQTEQSHVDVYRALKTKAERNHAWWGANTAEYQSAEDFSRFSAIYDDQRRVILAMRKENGKFRQGGTDSASNSRVTQILGRLAGTAKGNQEKERSAALAMQKRMASDLCHNSGLLRFYRDLHMQRIAEFSEEQTVRFVDKIADYINGVLDRRSAQSSAERESEAFPIDNEIFDEIMKNVVYQWNLEGNEKQDDPDVPETDDLETTANAFTWLLLLSLLRNECRRLNQTYLSTFQPKSAYLPVDHPVEYTETDDPDLIGIEEDVYTGNDLDRRFPGIEWYCDCCHEYLNIQKGFDDHLTEWRCQKCGYVNHLSLERIYESDASWQNGQRPVDRHAFTNALKVRREEVREGLTFRDGKPEDGPELADIEEICFPPAEQISRQVIVERAAHFLDQFLVSFDPSGKKIVGFIAGVATEKVSFTDDLFTDPSIHDPAASTMMITGLEVRPEYRQMGLATELMQRFIDRERKIGRKRIVLTCLDRLVSFYERMGYHKIGLSQSTLGGQAWYEMDMLL